MTSSKEYLLLLASSPLVEQRYDTSTNILVILLVVLRAPGKHDRADSICSVPASRARVGQSQ